jgi:hypothetical protein
MNVGGSATANDLIVVQNAPGLANRCESAAPPFGAAITIGISSIVGATNAKTNLLFRRNTWHP